MSDDFIVANGLLIKKFEDRNKISPSDKLEAIIFALMDNLVDRRGFRQVWDDCDEIIKEEILSELYERAKKIIGK